MNLWIPLYRKNALKITTLHESLLLSTIIFFKDITQNIETCTTISSERLIINKIKKKSLRRCTHFSKINLKLLFEKTSCFGFFDSCFNITLTICPMGAQSHVKRWPTRHASWVWRLWLPSTLSDGFSLISVIIGYITEYFKSHFTEKIWLKNYSQWKSFNK